MESEVKALFAGGMSDYQLASLEWSDDGTDLVVTLAPPGDRAKKIRIRFSWVTRVCVNLDFGGYGGRPLMYQAEACEVEGALGWRVVFVFGAAPEGEIKFDCNGACVLPGDQSA